MDGLPMISGAEPLAGTATHCRQEIKMNKPSRRDFLGRVAIATAGCGALPTIWPSLAVGQNPPGRPRSSGGRQAAGLLKELPRSRDWELLILDAAPRARSLDSLAIGDIDRDGRPEIVTGGQGALLWYRFASLERGVICEGHFQVGVALEDLDGDGRLEVVAGIEDAPGRKLFWFKASEDPAAIWRRTTIDGNLPGHAHDVLFADVDGDGKNELVAAIVYSNTPGLYIYKPETDLTAPWRRHCVQNGIEEEGLVIADLDQDGRLEIIVGPDIYHRPEDGGFAGPWRRSALASHFRKYCRATVAQISLTGGPDVFVAESEYPDGWLSRFENRAHVHSEQRWVEHPLADGLNFAHSVDSWREGSGTVHILAAEMSQGGWDAPRNYRSRLIECVSTDHGANWQRNLIDQGEGTHNARFADLDGDGKPEIVGKDAYEYVDREFRHPKVQIWKRRASPSVFTQFRHRFVDQDKPETATDLVPVDVDGDGRVDLACGRWWYRNPDWTRFEIPGVCQIVQAFDLDGDGRKELIAIKDRGGKGYAALNSELVWLKPKDPVKGLWEEFQIGTGDGDWPHGTLIAPLLPDGKLALVTTYHDPNAPHYPQLWEIPSDPRQGPWKKHVLAEIPYREEILAADLSGNGRLDIVAGAWRLENLGHDSFKPHKLTEGFSAARLAITDVNSDGRLDIIAGEEVLDFKNQKAPLSRLAWFENPGSSATDAWKMHVIDTVRCPHSVGAADLDGDGEVEIVCAEHDPFMPYHSECRLLVYKKADPQGRAWYRHTLDDRFEHHDGAKIFEVEPGRLAIASHGWVDSRYVHLWEPPAPGEHRR